MSKILSPADLERCCRFIVKFHPHQGALSIRVALAASILHENQWFSVRDVQTRLKGVGRDGSNVGEIAARIIKLGIAEHKLVSFPSYNRHDARLTCDLVDIGHFHGQRSKRLRDDFDVYYGLKPHASPLAALLLIGIHQFQIQQSNDLARFLEPEFDFTTKPALAARTLNQLDDAGLMTVFRPNSIFNRPFLVIPVART